MSLTVVTASIGEPSARLYTPLRIQRDVSYRCFTNNRNLHRATPWELVYREQVLPDPVRDAKRFKVLIHEHVDADASVWIDRHCRLGCNPRDVFQAHREADLILIKHSRGCIYHEARACVRRRKDDPELIKSVSVSYRESGHPPRYGLWYGGIIFRRHNNRTEEFARIWWELIQSGSRRDQLSLPVAIRLSGVKIVTINRDNIMSIRNK